jgi:hypothetical protein
VAKLSLRRFQWFAHVAKQRRVRSPEVFRLREARDDQRCGIASAARASRESARTWTRRKGTSQLAIAPKLAARYMVVSR